jgi:hypothetical protein
MQTQSENVMHQDKGALHRLQNENLRELVRRVLVALQNGEKVNFKLYKRDAALTCSLPSTLMRTPPSSVGCESTVVIIRLIVLNPNDLEKIK